MNWYKGMMGKVTEENALDLTIEKFEKSLSGEIKLHLGSPNCPLCRVYLNDSCYDCPVSYAGQRCEYPADGGRSLYQRLQIQRANGCEMIFIEDEILPFLRELKEEQVEK
jgi:hypothetical protein